MRHAIYRELGVAPGIPTMKGSYGDPENTGVGYNTIIKELGDHTVPAEWAQYVKHNTEADIAPGAPIQWDDPSDPESAQPGYGFVADNSGEPEETFYYHSDHLGSTSYITDKDGNITQYDAYLPYGELLVDEHSSSEDLPYKFNGKELDEETGLYYYGARYMQPMVSIWYGIDPLAEKYTNVGGYTYCLGNPIKLVDSDGKKVYLFATSLPGANWLPLATHTFIVVQDNKGKVTYAAYGPKYNDAISGNDVLSQCRYSSDIKAYKDFLNENVKSENVKGVELIPVPDGMTSDEFDLRVVNTIKAFGNNSDIKYNLSPTDIDEGNCNSSSSTILIKSGVDKKKIEEIKNRMDGFTWGFSSTPKPWTASEQKNAVKEAKQQKAEENKRLETLSNSL